MIDMGILRVEVIGAKNLMAGDRSGKSDVSSFSVLYTHSRRVKLMKSHM